MQGRRGKVLLVVVGTIAAVMLVEVGLRLQLSAAEFSRMSGRHAPPQSSRWMEHPFLPYAGRPNTNRTMHNDREPRVENVVTNSYGFRSHEFPAGKQPGDYVVLCLGGSTTFGYAATNDQTWPELLESKLGERYPDRNIIVLNLGVDMATSVISLVNLALIGAHLDPDLVIVYHGYNDLAALGATDYRPDHSHFYVDLDISRIAGYQHTFAPWLESSYALSFVTHRLDMVTRIGDLSSHVTRNRLPHDDPLHGIDETLRTFETMHAIVRGAGGRILFSTFQFRDGDSTGLNDRFRSFYESRGFLYVDQDRLIPDHDPTVNVDPCHFTQKGRDLVANNYFDTIVRENLVR